MSETTQPAAVQEEKKHPTVASLQKELDAERAQTKAQREATAKTLEALQRQVAMLSKSVEQEDLGPPQCRYIIGEDWIHPDTGERYMSGDKVAMPDDGAMVHEPNIRWQPLNAAGARRVKAQLIHHKNVKLARETRIKELRQEYGSLPEAETKLSEQLLAEANGHILDLDALIAGLDDYEAKQQKHAQDRAKEQKTANEKQLANQYAPYEKGNRGDARVNERSVTE